MTGEAVCGASMTSDVRPAHCTDMTYAKAAHVGCVDAPAVRGAHSPEKRSADETRSAHSTDMTDPTHPATTASVSAARCGKSEHDDRRRCSENLRHDESPLI
jgi:hypothetical protein